MNKHWIMGIATAASLCAMSAVASAGPAPSAPGLIAAAQQSSTATRVVDRGCWWANGVRRCGRVSARPRSFGYGYTSGYGGYGSGYGYTSGYGAYSGYPNSQTSYGYGDYYVDPDDLATGSTAWWRVMDEDGRGGFGSD